MKTPTNTKASYWWKTTAEFLQVCSDAQSMARGESSEEFAGQMMKRAKEHGLTLYLTEKQAKWLCSLADVPLPTPVKL